MRNYTSRGNSPYSPYTDNGKYIGTGYVASANRIQEKIRIKEKRKKSLIRVALVLAVGSFLLTVVFIKFGIDYYTNLPIVFVKPDGTCKAIKYKDQNLSYDCDTLPAKYIRKYAK